MVLSRPVLSQSPFRPSQSVVRKVSLSARLSSTSTSPSIVLSGARSKRSANSNCNFKFNSGFNSSFNPCTGNTHHRFSAAPTPGSVRMFGINASSVPPHRSSSKFTQEVVATIRQMYPEMLADSWDNTGLLLEAPEGPYSHNLKNRVLLTIDLTQKVADEAIDRGCSIIIAYHPIIFSKLSALTLANTQQNTLLRLAAAGISVYSPHTAVDGAVGGLADWLADMVSKNIAPQDKQPSPSSFPDNSWLLSSIESSDMAVPSLTPNSFVNHTRVTIIPHEKVPHAGMGRLVTFTEPQPLSHILDRIWQGIGKSAAVPVALPQTLTAATALAAHSEPFIKRVAVCAGSGSTIFSSVIPLPATYAEDGRVVTDLLFTGEMSHHDVLAATEQMKVVVTPGHSVTERAYLHQIMRLILEQELNARVPQFGAEVFVSEQDRDPYMYAIRRLERPVDAV